MKPFAGRARIDLRSFTKWSDTLDRYGQEKAVESLGAAEKPYRDWVRWRTAVAEEGEASHLLELRRYLDRFAYKRDSIYRDHWQTPGEFLRAGAGDCEDFAILGYFTLRALGWSVDRVRLLVVDQDIGPHHAILAARTAKGEDMVVDILYSLVVKARMIKSYKPIYGLDETRWWDYRMLPRKKPPARRQSRDAVRKGKAPGG